MHKVFCLIQIMFVSTMLLGYINVCFIHVAFEVQMMIVTSIGALVTFHRIN